MTPGWFASFADLRVAGVTLAAWLAYYRAHPELRVPFYGAEVGA